MARDSQTDTTQMGWEASIVKAHMITSWLLQRVEAEVVAEVLERVDGETRPEVVAVASRDSQGAPGPPPTARITKVHIR